MVWTIVGDAVYRRLVVPFGFLIFAIPIGGEIVPWLMVATADVSGAGLELLGVPFHREGMFFTLPGGVFEVADACSGIRYLNAGLMVGALVAVLYFRSWIRRIAYVLAIGVAFIATNGIRAFVVMAVASGTDMKYLADHILFGWVLFLAVLVAMIFAADRYSDA
jgi:exosortase